MKITILSLIITIFACAACEAQTDKSSIDSCAKVNAWVIKQRDSFKAENEELKAKYADCGDGKASGNTDSSANLEKNIDQLLEYTTNIAWKMTFKGKSYDVYVVDTEANTLKLYLKNSQGKNYTFSDILEEQKSKNSRLAFAMNAGMYDPNRNPVGLYVENGKEINKINKQTLEGNFYMKPNGVVGLTKNNKAFVVATEDYKYEATDLKWATQSGPMLLNKGEINSNFKDKSTNVNIRNGVGIVNDTKMVFAISNDQVNFYDFAELFKNVFSCKFALYLDGAISQMYLPELKRTASKGAGLGPIITVIR